MTTHYQSLLIGTLAVALSSFSVPASVLAQVPATMPQHGHEMHWQMHPEKFAEHTKRREIELHDALKLTPQQEGAWTTFADQTRPTVPMAWHDHAEMEKLSAPDRLEKMLAMMRASEQQLTQRLAATKTFYAVLTPAQRVSFDQQFGRHHQHGHHAEHGAPGSEQK
jgi:protein CpxP